MFTLTYELLTSSFIFLDLLYSYKTSDELYKEEIKIIDLIYLIYYVLFYEYDISCGFAVASIHASTNKIVTVY